LRMSQVSSVIHSGASVFKDSSKAASPDGRCYQRDLEILTSQRLRRGAPPQN
jgi:hypothetical protein